MVVAVRYYNEAKDSVCVYQNLSGFLRAGKIVSFYLADATHSLDIEFDSVVGARQVEEAYLDALESKENHTFWFYKGEEERASWGVEGANHG